MLKFLNLNDIQGLMVSRDDDPPIKAGETRVHPVFTVYRCTAPDFGDKSIRPTRTNYEKRALFFFRPQANRIAPANC